MSSVKESERGGGRKRRREGVNAPDRSFDGDGEEEGFWHERGAGV